MLKLQARTAGALVFALMTLDAVAETGVRIQSVLGSVTDEVFMLQSFLDDVEGLTGV